MTDPQDAKVLVFHATGAAEIAPGDLLTLLRMKAPQGFYFLFSDPTKITHDHFIGVARHFGLHLSASPA